MKCVSRRRLLSILKIVYKNVALFTRAWIEIMKKGIMYTTLMGRPLYEGVD